MAEFKWASGHTVNFQLDAEMAALVEAEMKYWEGRMRDDMAKMLYPEGREKYVADFNERFDL